MANPFQTLFGAKDADAHTDHAAGGPLHVTDADFAQTILQAEMPAVVDLWADWCGPCHMIAPAVNQLAENYAGRAVVAKMNVDENPNTPGRYGIMGIPTLLFFKDGKEVDRQVGVANYAALARKLDRILG